MNATAKRLNISTTAHEPSPKVFHFKEPYGPDGGRIAIDRAGVRRIAARNAEKQRDLLAHVLSVGV